MSNLNELMAVKVVTLANASCSPIDNNSLVKRKKREENTEYGLDKDVQPKG
jgi:hypothetical protein